MKNIALVIPYFGKFPNYFPLFLISCKNNPSIDWLIYTDAEELYDWPENVHVRQTDFEGFKEKLQKVIQFPIVLNKPYKLCDFKPVYGEALQDDLKGYDFWGYCDCDLIFGDIRKFVTEEVLDKYKKLFTRGHLTLYHNDPETNAFYRTQKQIDIKEVFTNPRAFAFDEWGGISECWADAGRPYYDELIFDDIRHNLDGLHPTKEISGYGSPYHDKYQEKMAPLYRKMKNVCYFYNKGGGLERIWRAQRAIKREEILYVHLQKRKMEVAASLTTPDDGFIIVADAFLEKCELDLAALQKLAPSTVTAHNVKEMFKQWVRNVIK